ncbi:MAG: cytochrome C [Gemmatimonadetes bacterium]|nr:cytochrome C [Gemmatimonadota bacterium]
MTARISVLVLAAALFTATPLTARDATADRLPATGEPIPSFSRQTGLACNVCHTAFPQLTSFGRTFKLNGYTMTTQQLLEAGDSTGRSLKLDLIAPVSAMVEASATVLKTAQPGTQNGNVLFPQQLSIFLGEEITPRLGAFVQLTYDPEAGGIGMDNAEIRYANHAAVGRKDLTYGFTLNNNPTMQDLWNTTPAWGFPFASSPTAPSPAAAPLIAGALAQQVAGLGAYASLNNTVYGEVTAYRSAPKGGRALPDSASEGTLKGVAPYGRLVLEHQWSRNYLALGAYGMSARQYPTGTSGETNRYADLGFDAQYEHRAGEGFFTVHGTWIHEKQTLDASFADSEAANPTNTLNSFRGDASYYVGHHTHLVGATAGYFSTTGSADATLYAPGPITGNGSGSPNSNGLIGELVLLPWLNTRFALQYVAYTKFNGSKLDYDGSGRKASDNNSLYLLAWLIF